MLGHRAGCPVLGEKPGQVIGERGVRGSVGCHSLGGCSGLHTSSGCQRPVLARVGAEGTLSRVPIYFQLEGLLIGLFILIGRQVHSCRERDPSQSGHCMTLVSPIFQDGTEQWAS